MNKTFVIRKIAYHYSDDHLYVHTLGGIESTFSSEEEAKKEFLRLERTALEEARFKEYCGSPYFYNTYSEALKQIRSELTYHFNNKQILGSLNSLTANPSFLMSLINSTSKLEYDIANQILQTKYPNQEEAIALNELLNNKPLEIKEIPYSDVKDIEHWTYEQM